jgi:hypothetical protein
VPTPLPAVLLAPTATMRTVSAWAIGTTPSIPNAMMALCCLIESHETSGLLEMYNAMPSADWGVNFCMPNEIKIITITRRRYQAASTNHDVFRKH